jgi:hypothetical protein
MPNVFIRSMLFLSSYFPLLIIFGILSLKKENRLAWAIGLFIVSITSVVVMGGYLFVNQQMLAVSQDKLTDYKKRDVDVMAYIASYLIPFVTFPLDTPLDGAALLVFIGVLLVVYINSNMIYINPMLNVLGYHLYEVELEHSSLSHYYIARRRLVRGEMIHFVRLSDEIFLEKV